MARQTLGNGMGRKPEKNWRDALMIAVNRRDQKSNKKYLALIAERCVLMALQGDMSAIREIGDRLDGRALTLEGNPDNPINIAVTRIERVIVDAAVTFDEELRTAGEGVANPDRPRVPTIDHVPSERRGEV